MRTTSITLTQGDPFSDVLTSLQQSTSKIADIAPPLTTAADVVGTIEEVLDATGVIITVFDDLEEVVQLVEGVLPLLSPFPVVGEIADGFEAPLADVKTALAEVKQIFQQVKQDVVDPVKKVLDDIQTGLVDVQKVVLAAGEQLPNYLNTIQILNYLTEIAAPLVQVLEGTGPDGPEQRLNDLLDKLNQVKAGVVKVAGPMAKGLADVETGVQYLATEMKKAGDVIGGHVRDAVNLVRGAAGIFQPISDAFNRVLNVLKPLKWLLEAVQWLVDHSLKPAIDEILTVTGLKKLMQGAEQKLLDKLGVGPVANLLRSNINQGDIGAQQSSVGSQQGTNMSTLWSGLGTALGDYRTNKSAALQDGMITLVSAIAGTPIDPNKPAVIPDWDLPDLHTSTQNALQARSVVRATRTLRLRAGFAGLDRMRAPALAAARPTAFAVLHSTPAGAPGLGPEWQPVSDLTNEITQTVASLQQLQQSVSTLGTMIPQFDTSLTLPGTFGEHVGDLAAILQSISDLFNSIERFNIFNNMIEPFRQMVTQQAGNASQVTAAVDGLKQAVAQVDQAANPVLQSAPSPQVITDTISRLQSWSDAVVHLVNTVELGQQANVDLNNAYSDGLADLQNRINQSASDLSVRLKTIDDSAAGLQHSLDTLTESLAGYSATLGQISSHSELIYQKALPSVSKAAHVLGVIDSIVDPLSALLQEMKCVDAQGSNMKASAATAVQAMKDRADQDTSPLAKSLANVLGTIADKDLPLGQLHAVVVSANETLSTKTLQAFQSVAAPLTQALQQLTQAMTETKSYESPGKDGTPTQWSNDLVDQALATAATTLFKEMGAKRPPGWGGKVKLTTNRRGGRR
jgi:prefoldin subunit 5